jgi:hypothetical protein
MFCNWVIGCLSAALRASCKSKLSSCQVDLGVGTIGQFQVWEISKRVYSRGCYMDTKYIQTFTVLRLYKLKLMSKTCPSGLPQYSSQDDTDLRYHQVPMSFHLHISNHLTKFATQVHCLQSSYPKTGHWTLG